ncbi:hypothetical protein DL767_009908 [Monosporascus sp. MG133]|nr:hypothetical protein DL767_009908 [Monosporascus sp. MG133]
MPSDCSDMSWFNRQQSHTYVLYRATAELLAPSQGQIPIPRRRLARPPTGSVMDIYLPSARRSIRDSDRKGIPDHRIFIPLAEQKEEGEGGVLAEGVDL